MAATIELYLVRHAIAAERGPKYPDDRLRPLTPAGAKKFAESVPGLVEMDVVIDFVLTSPLVRARETAHAARRRPEAEAGDRGDRSARAGRPASGRSSKRSRRTRSAIAGSRSSDTSRISASSPRGCWAPAATIEFKKGAVCLIEVDGATPGGPGTLRWMLPPQGLARARALMPTTRARRHQPHRRSGTHAHDRRVRRSRQVQFCPPTTTTPTSASRPARRMRIDSRSEAVAANVDLVVAWGGDGTVNGAASGVAGTGIPLAIIPGGSGNGLARDLLIPFNPTAAFTIAATGATRAIDAGDLHGSLFFNVAGVGFDARIADRLAEPGARRGLLGYIFATVSELRGYEPGRYSIHDVYDVDGKALVADITDRPALFIALANSRQYGSGAQIAPRALLDDGMMEIVVVEPQSALEHHAAGAGVFSRHAARRPGTADAIGGGDGDLVPAPDSFSRRRRAAEGPESHRLRTRRGVLSVKVSR